MKTARVFLKICLLNAAIGLSGNGLAATTSNELPVAFPPARYEAMAKTSPFALATPTAAPVAPGFASSLYLTGVAKIGNKDFVTIASRDQPTRFSLTADEPGNEGVSLVSVEWSEQVGKSKVTIKKGTEFATLEFDQAILQKPFQVTPQQPQVPQIPQLGGPPQRPVILPRTNQPQANPAGQPPPVPRVNQPNAAYPQITQPIIGGEGRKRIRIIPSKP